MIDDSESSASYFMQVARLAERLASKGIAIYEHKFHYTAFGSWELVAGRRDRMVRFSYDGKDSWLSYGAAASAHRDGTGLEHRRVRTWEGEDPLAFTGDVLEEHFSQGP